MTSDGPYKTGGLSESQWDGPCMALRVRTAVELPGIRTCDRTTESNSLDSVQRML